MNLIKRIWSFLTGGTLIWLRDYDGEETLAIARVSPFGYMTAERWWPISQHLCKLNKDGTIENGSYVKKWVYYHGGTNE